MRANATFPASWTCPLRRRGTATPWLIAGLLAIFWIFAWAFDVAILRHRQLDLRVNLDAVTLAGAAAAVDDMLLTDAPDRQDNVIASIRATAQKIGEFNRFSGSPFTFEPNLDNCVDGNFVLGTLDNPTSENFNADLSLPPDLYHPQLNAVRMQMRTGGVAASSTAFVDRDVVGFKPQGTLTVPLEKDILSCQVPRNDPALPAIPVVPLAILTDPCFPLSDDNAVNQTCWEARNPNSWEYRIMARKGVNDDGTDDWMMDVGSCDPEFGSDGIVEMRVTISEAGHQQSDNTQVLVVGAETTAETISQLLTGITYEQLLRPRHDLALPAFNGQLLLNDDLDQNNPQNLLILPRQALTASEIDALATNLDAIRGQRRVWMLYSQVQQDNTAIVVGFVVARVMHVETVLIGHTQLMITIQPSMLVTATAVTDYTRRNWGPRSLFNPYTCKVRLVE